MRILVLYSLRNKKIRKTITEHLYSFKKYAPEHQFIYVNVDSSGIPFYLKQIFFDAVLLHYTFLAGERFLPGNAWDRKIKGLDDLKGYKIAIPQDEYCCTDRLIQLFDKIKVDVVCTCFYTQEDIHFAYESHLSHEINYVSVLTGYIDENLVGELDSYVLPYAHRKIDIGYRASMLPANFGKHGQLKYELIGEFTERLKNSGLTLDIKRSNTTISSEDKAAIKLGDAWNHFLLECKAFIGCEGGSSLIDFDGTIQEKVYAYSCKHPDAKFDEIESACFPGMDFNISCFAISPRHFEAVITKTLQILVEGYYGGIFKPGVHYLELKKDYSNFEEVIAQLSNNEKCQEMIDRSFEDIALSGRYTYKSFVNTVLENINSSNGTLQKSAIDDMLIWVLNLRNSYLKILYKIYDKCDPYYYFVYNKYVKHIKPYFRSEG